MGLVELSTWGCGVLQLRLVFVVVAWRRSDRFALSGLKSCKAESQAWSQAGVCHAQAELPAQAGQEPEGPRCLGSRGVLWISVLRVVGCKQEFLDHDKGRREDDKHSYCH